MSAHCIAVAAHKGGAGKTTLSVNLAGAIGLQGLRVVVVDGDPQGAASIGLGVVPVPPSLYEVLRDEVSASGAVVETGAPGVSVLPATDDLAGAEVEIPQADPTGWRTAMRDRLRPLLDQADVIIIDTPPGLGVLSYMALGAADQVLVACPADFLAVRSLPKVLESVGRAGVELIGIVPTMIEHRTRHESDFRQYLTGTYEHQLLSPIPRRVVLRDAMAAGQPITTYLPGCDAAGAFQILAKEVLNAISS